MTLPCLAVAWLGGIYVESVLRLFLRATGCGPDSAALQYSSIPRQLHVGCLSRLLANEIRPPRAQRNCLL